MLCLVLLWFGFVVVCLVFLVCLFVCLFAWLLCLFLCLLAWFVCFRFALFWILFVFVCFGFLWFVSVFVCFVSFFRSFLCFVLFCFVLFCFVSFCFALLCFALLCFALFCFAMFCIALFVFNPNHPSHGQADAKVLTDLVKSCSALVDGVLQRKRTIQKSSARKFVLVTISSYDFMTITVPLTA